MVEIMREEGGSQFTLQALFKELKKKLLLVIAIILFCTAVGGVYGGVVVDTTYTTNATMIVNVGNDGTLEQAKSLATALKSIVDPENDVIYDLTATTFVSKNPNYPMKRDELKAELKKSISVTTNAMLLNLTMSTTLPEAESILNLFMKQMMDFVNVKVEGSDAYVYPLFAEKIDIISPAGDVKDDSNSKVFKYMALFFIVGAFASMLLVFLKVFLNNTYTDKASFEMDFDMDVIATIEDIGNFCDDATEKVEEGV